MKAKNIIRSSVDAMVTDIETAFGKKFDEIPPALKTSVTGAQASAEALLATDADDEHLLVAWSDYLYASRGVFETATQEFNTCLPATLKSL